MLQTAPCSTCKALLVFGERACRGCGQTFDYGPTPPPIPSAEQIAAALRTAGAAPFAPATEMIIDRARHDEVEVNVEEVPGLIDSSLYAKYTPKDVDNHTLDGLQMTSHHTGDVAEVAAPVGFIDSTLYAKYTPDEVQTVPVEGIQVFAGASRLLDDEEEVLEEGEEAPCSDCGTPHARSTCPSCGARRG